MALIPLQRAVELLPNFSDADSATLSSIINACSDLIEKFCNRKFAVASYDEVYDGNGSREMNILLNNFPVVSVSRVALFLQNVLMVQNTDSSQSIATVRLDATSLYLAWETNGVAGAATLPLASYPTLASLATAISAVSGWTAAPLGDIFGAYPSSFLRAPQGAFDVRWTGSCYLKLHTYHLPSFEQNPAIGELVLPTPFSGYQSVRVVYSAGFPEIPEPVQQACAELAVMVYQGRGQNPNLVSENLGGYSYTRQTEMSFKNLSAASAAALAQFKNHRVPRWRVGA
ncbi:head-tail connector protein [Zavarzinella formosa]|uniref:hypothetical protein n=1 Tax=Zavarzinella formosa TaxID=360055 RepID=UPI0002E93E70|nr:hypothetical protein [Zavarzinella formosa]